jgi:hypothetical protein
MSSKQQQQQQQQQQLLLPLSPNAQQKQQQHPQLHARGGGNYHHHQQHHHCYNQNGNGNSSSSTNGGVSQQHFQSSSPLLVSPSQQQQHQQHFYHGHTMNTTSTTAMTTTTTTTTVDDAKYDRRIKQRLLLRSQRQQRRKQLRYNCYYGCIRSLRTISVVLVLMYCMKLLYQLIVVSVSLSSESLELATAVVGPQVQEVQPQRLPPLRQKEKVEDEEKDEQHLPRTTSKLSLEMQFQQLRASLLATSPTTTGSHHYFVSPKVTNVQQQQQQQLIQTLLAWQHEEDYEIQQNLPALELKNQPRFTRPYLLPPIILVTTRNEPSDSNLAAQQRQAQKQQVRVRSGIKFPTLPGRQIGQFFRVKRCHHSSEDDKELKHNIPHHQSSRKKKYDNKSMDDDRSEKNNNSNNNNDPQHSMKWQEEYETLVQQYGTKFPGPLVDYTNRTLYEYPKRIVTPPNDASYPPLQSLQSMLHQWPQNVDYNAINTTTTTTTSQPRKIIEQLQHFDYQNPHELQMAIQYRDAELPFKLYNVPELDRATKKWDDHYVSQMFGNNNDMNSFMATSKVTVQDETGSTIQIPTAQGTAQESRDHYFAFFVGKQWDVVQMGLPPTRIVQDWNYMIWSQHAQYADATRLSHDQPHFYWQAGIPAEERHLPYDKWTFISRDLPIFSSPTDNVFVFHVDEQKGIQCRFGERGVVAATHFDSGRNMVAMITGAKRYILSPPNQCSKLGIFTEKVKMHRNHKCHWKNVLG